MRGAGAASPRNERAERVGEALCFRVDGMCCATEARQIESKLSALDGVGRVEIDVVGRQLRVSGGVGAEAVERAVGELGMQARRVGAVEPPSSWWQRHGRAASAAAAGVLWAASLLARALLAGPAPAAALAVLSLAAGGWLIVPRGLRAAMQPRAGHELPHVRRRPRARSPSGSTRRRPRRCSSSPSRSSWRRARWTARAGPIRALMELSPAEATVLRDGRRGAGPRGGGGGGRAVLVRPGEKIPVDGEVVAGRSGVNQAPITGESIPVEKEPGTEVFAGTLNGEGALEVRAERPAADTHAGADHPLGGGGAGQPGAQPGASWSASRASTRRRWSLAAAARRGRPAAARRLGAGGSGSTARWCCWWSPAPARW